LLLPLLLLLSASTGATPTAVDDNNSAVVAVAAVPVAAVASSAATAADAVDAAAVVSGARPSRDTARINMAAVGSLYSSAATVAASALASARALSTPLAGRELPLELAALAGALAAGGRGGVASSAPPLLNSAGTGTFSVISTSVNTSISRTTHIKMMTSSPFAGAWAWASWPGFRNLTTLCRPTAAHLTHRLGSTLISGTKARLATTQLKSSQLELSACDE
jgi:hypothetical protein